jgi:hypothetical protein
MGALALIVNFGGRRCVPRLPVLTAPTLYIRAVFPKQA